MSPSVSPLRTLASSGRTLRKLLAPSVVFALGLCVTVAATLATFKSIAASERARFERVVAGVRNSLDERLESDIDAVHAAAGLFATTGELTQVGFERFVRHLSPVWRDRTRSVGWTMRLPAPHLPAFVRQMHRRGHGSFELKPSGTREEYFPILYAHPPLSGAFDHVGFDIGSESVLRTAMERATMIGNVATSEVFSVKAGEKENVLFLFFPVFAAGASLETLPQRQQALRGFVFTTLNADTLAQGVGSPETLTMTVGPSKPRTAVGAETSLTEVEGSLFGEAFYRTRRTVGVGDRAWTVNFVSTAAFAAASPWGYLYLTAAGALLITLLLTGVTWSEARARAEAELTNARLAQSEEALKRANRAKDEFLGMVSHELRNPLGAMAGALKVVKLRGSVTDAAARRALDVAERQVRHQSRLVDDLLDVTRLATSNILLDVRPIDVNALLTRAVAAVRHLAAEQHHLLTLTRTERAVVVDGDAVRLEQIVSNLLINSIKYTPKGGLIEVELSRTEEHALVHVRDDGAGIPAELIDSVFAPFYQERLGTSANKGLGLGLTIAQRLVALHGGQITVESAGRDLGTEFVVKLPLSSASIADACRLETGSYSPEESVGPTREDDMRARVLVIDDMEDGRQVLRDLLEALDVEVFDTGTGARGVELVQEVGPHLALIDIDLPDIDGFEVARRIRATQTGEHTKLVAITGYGATEDRNKAMSTGFDDYLVKPIDMARLSALLGGLVLAHEHPN